MQDCKTLANNNQKFEIKMEEKYKYISRFTTLPYLVDILINKKLTLLNPLNWEDKNEQVTLSKFKDLKKKTAIYCLCLTDSDENIHHWNQYAPSKNGCYVKFNYNKLLALLKENKDLMYGNVEYLKIEDLKKRRLDTERFPFLKRHPFRTENEFRIISISDEEQKPSFDLPIDLSIIERITFSTNLEDNVYESVKAALIQIEPSLRNKINHSKLLKFNQWKKYFEEQ